MSLPQAHAFMWPKHCGQLARVVMWHLLELKWFEEGPASLPQDPSSGEHCLVDPQPTG